MSSAWAPALLLIIITILTYLPVWQAGFIWDDDAMVTDNRLIKMPGALWRFWFTTEPPDYFPLVSTLLWAQWRMWGMNPLGYHVVQVLLHSAAVVVLWRVLRKLPVPGAWWAAAVFAVHPVNVETVAWITETKNTLPMVLYLGSILCYLRYQDAARGRDYVLALFLFLLALLGKTSVVMLPVVLLIISWWRTGKVQRTEVVRTAPFFALSLILGLVTIWFQSHRAIIHTVIREDGLLSRFAVAAMAIWFYLYKALLPINLCFVYPRWNISVVSILTWLPLLCALGAFLIAWLKRNDWGRHLLAALGYFTVSLLPVLGFANIYFMRYSLVADHWQYVALPGVIVCLVGALASSRLRDVITPGNARIAGAILVTALAVLSFLHARNFRDNETLFTHVLEHNPSAWIAHNNLGIVLAQKGHLDAAALHYNKALELKPDLSDAHLNLANVLAARGDDAGALTHYQESLRLQPYYKTHNALGEVHLRAKRTDDAMRSFQEAIRMNPDFYLAHANLGEAQVALKQFDRAIKSYQRALDLAPGKPDLHNQLARVYMLSGNALQAIQQLRDALRLHPNYGPGYMNLGTLLGRQGQKEEAIQMLQHAQRLEPGNAQIGMELQRLQSAR